MVQNLANELSYRLALSLNTLVQVAADSANGTDSTVYDPLAAGSYLTAANIRTAVAGLVGKNARPLYPNAFGGLIHPYAVQDLLNDSTNNGLSDILKRNESTVNKLVELPSNEDVIEFAGAKFKQTTTCPSVTVSGTAGFYQTYLFADDALFSVFLGKSPETGEKNYKLNVQVAPEGGSPSDPARVIGGWVSYNTKFTCALRPGTTQVIRIIQAQSSMS